MPSNAPRRTRRALGGLATAALLGTAALVPTLTTTASATPAPDPVLDSGGGPGERWEVTRAAGGYQVSLELPEPLEMRSDAPTLVVDGETLGIAAEDPDGLGLRVFTTDPGITHTLTVEAGWASETEAPAGARRAETSAVGVPDLEGRAAAPLTADPAAPGGFEWTESIYRFGDQAVPLQAIGGVRGELEGKLYLPTTGGARPTVLLLHGRHTSCYGPGIPNPDRWPCAVSPDLEDRRSIPSYAGYDALARILAGNGYAVVSVSANAVNSNDNQLAADQGAVARGQLLLDTLTLLEDADAGRPVSHYDAWSDRALTLDQALAEGTRSYAARADGFLDGAPPLDAVTAADLVGRFDLSSIGMMGHSRGGEGVTAATTLNQALTDPWHIESILPLAPVDFGRMTVPDVPMNVVLPYCDGDVSNQQGQHLLDDSRHAFGDDVLRTGTWVMGANHNFYNTVWTPGRYAFSVSDDWSGTSPTSARATEPICGTAPSTSGTSIRLSPQAQYEQGASYMAAWFLLTLGGREEFLPMFDGTGAVPAALGDVDVRTQATAPASDRATVATFERATPLVRTANASLVTCASLAGRTTPQDLAPCATTLASAQAPHWTPASNGGNVPATPVGRMTWTAADAEVRIGLPAARRDASGFDRLAIKLAADESVAEAVDMQLAVVDRTGATYRAPVSELNPLALTRLPTSESTAALTTLKKVVLQQVNVPVADLTAAGLDVADLREVRLTALPDEDAGTPDAGGVYLSDLAWERSGVGTAVTAPRTTISVFAPKVDEGEAPGTYDVAVYLDEAATEPVSGYVSLLGTGTARAGALMERVTFAPGETCRVVTAALQGDAAPSTANGTTVKASVVNTSGAVMGRRAIVNTVVREDDGTVPATSGTLASPLPAVGTPGAVCEELEAYLDGGRVTTPEAAAPAGSLPVGAAGFRPGETVTFTAAGLAPVTVVADAAGLATAELTVPADAARGAVEVTATGFATERVATGSTAVRDPSTVALGLLPEAPAAREALTLTATVTTAGGEDGTVTFADGGTTLGTADVEDGAATLALPGGLGGGEHALTATFGGSEVTSASTSAPVRVTVARRASGAGFRGLGFAAGGRQVRATVVLDGGGYGRPTDARVTLRIRGDASRTITRPVGPDGRVTFSVSVPASTSRLQVSAAAFGSRDFLPGATAVRTLRR